MGLNRQQHFLCMVGISGSGKSTFVKDFGKGFDYFKVISTDKIREELCGDAADQSKNDLVWARAYEMMREGFQNGNDVILDATNLTRKGRAQVLKEVPNNIEKIAIVIATPLNLCHDFDAARERTVGLDIIKKQLSRFEMPLYAEGWDSINVVSDYTQFYSLEDICEAMERFNQDNPHHKLMLGAHCEKASIWTLRAKNTKPWTYMAAFLHDIGKLSTKTFENYKGKRDGAAHYPSHSNYGAYMSLMIKYPEELRYMNKYKIEIAQLINYHMQMYQLPTDAARDRWKKRLGEDIFEQLEILHAADIAAH